MVWKGWQQKKGGGKLNNKRSLYRTVWREKWRCKLSHSENSLDFGTQRCEFEFHLLPYLTSYVTRQLIPFKAQSF